MTRIFFNEVATRDGFQIEPAFIPMTEVRTRSLADRRIITRYGFAVLNRRHIVAATGMPAGMTRSGWI